MAGAVRRGDVVIVSAPGAYGKPHPAVVVQSDWLNGTDSVLVSLLTSTVRDAPIFRLTLDPSPDNGLTTTSQVMIDKIVALPREKCGAVIGRLDDRALITLNHMLSVMLGLAD